MASYRFVEDLSDPDEGATVALEGQTLPAPCVVEDEDGVRLLLLRAGQERMRPSTWVSAYTSGAALLVRVQEDGATSVLLAEQFLARRRESLTDGTLEAVGWRDWSPAGSWPPPTFRDAVLLGDAAPASTASLAEAGSSLAGAGRHRGFVHLHTHSEYSALDGLSTLDDLADRAAADGQPALGITDHGGVEGHPALQAACDRVGIRPIFGLEAYFQPDRHRRAVPWEEGDPRTREEAKEQNQDALYGYWHLTLLAMTQQGLSNLWAMSSEAWRDGLYGGKPRLDWDTLERLGEGVIATTGCLGGPVCSALRAGRHDEARQVLARLLAIFGDRLYVELGSIDIPDQVEVNRQLVELARETGTPMVVTVDSHYAHDHDKETHRNWLRMQPSVNEDSYLVQEHTFEPFRTGAEVARAIAYLGPDVVEEAMGNTLAIAERCEARVQGALSKPIYSKGGTREQRIQRDIERLVDLCLSNWERKVRGKPISEQVYAARFEREMRLIIGQQYPGYFLVTSDLVRYAKDQGVLVGPCRGSGGASLVAYLCDITEVDPIAADLPFERFLTEERVEMPDFDLDFPTSRRRMLQEYAVRRWGAEHVVLIGSHVRAAPKKAIQDAVRVMEAQGRPIDRALLKTVTTVIDDYAATLAGATPKWEDVWNLFADRLEPARAAMPEVFELAARTVRLLKTYGTHAAGLVISTETTLTDLPTRVDKHGRVITQFDHRQLADLGHIKYDLLTLRTLDTIQDAVDLIKERYGLQIDVYGWREEYLDPQVWHELSEGHTLGVFQIETKAGRRMTRRIKPQSIADLSAIMALNRPGPLDSGLAETYLRRRFGEEEVSYPDDRLVEVLGETYGAIVYQEQIMQIAVLLAGYSLGEADTKIRKILGKKLREKIPEAGREFLQRAVECGTDRKVAEQLWDGMKEFASYSFNKAHSWGYAVLAYWVAFLKVHYPLEFLTAALSTVEADRVPEFVDEARRMGYRVLPPDINESRLGFTPTDTVVRYGLASVKGIGEPTAQAIVAGQPYDSFEDFVATMVEPKGSKTDRGHLLTLVQVGAFDSLVPNRRALEMQLVAEKSGEALRCVHKDEGVLGAGGLPCTFDWANEPDPPMVAKGRGKLKVLSPKPPPAKCTVACRQYRKPAGLDPTTIAPYTDDDIRQREREMLGVWLSSTPFDRLDERTLSGAHEVSQIENGGSGEYVVAAVVTRVTPKVDRSGGTYAWVTLQAPDGSLDVACWSRTYRAFHKHLRQDALVAAVLDKNSRGISITSIEVV